MSSKETGRKKRVAYYPGCSLEGLAREYDDSTRAVCAAVGIELVEIPDWNCCGSTPAHSLDPLLSAALAGRNLAIAAALECEQVMTPCPGCLKSLKGALEVYRDGERRAKLVELMGMSLNERLKVVSVLQLLFEEVGTDVIAREVVRPLSGWVIAPYYGCLLSRPAKVAQFDDAENPVSMDRLLDAAGATVPDFPYKTECCGATYGVTRNEIVGRLSGRILDMAGRLGAHAVAVACPLCQQNLDLRQPQINRHGRRAFHIPVIYITQAIGLALGIDPKSLGMDKLFVDAKPLLDTLVAAGENAETAHVD